MTMALRTSQVAAAAGVNAQTLRYYERRGLLAEPDRTSGGHRMYPPEAVVVLRIVKAAQRLGFTLDEVADLMESGPHRHGTDRGLQTRARSKLAEVDARIRDLQTIRATLVEALEAGCDDLAACASSSCCPLPFTELADGSGTNAHGERMRQASAAAMPATTSAVARSAHHQPRTR